MELGKFSKGVGYLDSYKMLLKAIKVNRLAEDKAREVFGSLTTLTNEFSIGKSLDNILKNYGKTVPYEERSGAYRTIVNVYIKDFDKADSKEYFEKVYELGKKLAYEMNYRTVMLVYLKPISSLEDVDFLNRTMLSISLKHEGIKEVIEKVEKGEKLTEVEKNIVVNNISKNEIVNSNYYMYSLWTTGEKNKSFNLETVTLSRKGGEDWNESILLDINGIKIYNKK